MMTEARRILARELFDIGAIKFGAFRLKLHEKKPDAPLSPIYIDLRILRSFPMVMGSAVQVYKELMEGLKYDVLCDVPTAATPLVALLSYELQIPMISPRKDQKAYGTQRIIDGVFKEDQIVLLIDDLITKAESKREAIAVLKENSLEVRDIVVLVGREQGGVQELEKLGYACHIGFELKGLLKSYLESGIISEQQYKETINYLDNA